MAVNSNEYFSTLETTQRLDLLRHLIENSELVPLVRGAAGMGKSLLAERLQQLAPENWSVCRFEAKPTLSPAHLLLHISRCIGWTEMKGDPMQGLITRFESLREKGITPVLLVDDAHLLPPTSLITLLRLYERQLAGNPLVSIVLFANEQIDMLLSTPQLQIMSPQAIQVIDLLPFSREDASAFMHFLLQVEDLPAEFELDDLQLTRLYRETGGIPGPLRQAILNAISAVEIATPGSDTGRRQLLLIAAPLLVLIGAMLVFQEEINRFFEPHRPESITQAEIEQSEAQKSGAKQATDRQTVNMPVVVPADPPPLTNKIETESMQLTGKAESVADIQDHAPLSPAPLLDEPAVESFEEDLGEEPPDEEAPSLPPAFVESGPLPADEPTAISQAPTEPHSIPEPEPEAAFQSAVESQSQPQADAKIHAEQMPVKPTPPAEPITVDIPGQQTPDDPLRRDEWVLARPASHYTLQLLGVEGIAALKAFIRRYELGEDAFYVETRRMGRPWYPLLWGEFPDKLSAIEASKRLPANLQQRDIWPRSYGSLQSLLNK